MGHSTKEAEFIRHHEGLLPNITSIPPGRHDRCRLHLAEAGGHVRGGVLRAFALPVLAVVGWRSAAYGVWMVCGDGPDGDTEAFAYPYHQQRLVEASATETVQTSSFHINGLPNAPVWVLRNLATAIGTGSASRTGGSTGKALNAVAVMIGDFATMAL